MRLKKIVGIGYIGNVDHPEGLGEYTKTGFARDTTTAKNAAMQMAPKEWNKKNRRYETINDRIVKIEIVDVTSY